MILMSKYKGQHGGKKGQKIRARPSPPPFHAMPDRNGFFPWEVFPYRLHFDKTALDKPYFLPSSDKTLSLSQTCSFYILHFDTNLLKFTLIPHFSSTSACYK